MTTREQTEHSSWKIFQVIRKVCVDEYKAKMCYEEAVYLAPSLRKVRHTFDEAGRPRHGSWMCHKI